MSSYYRSQAELESVLSCIKDIIEPLLKQISTLDWTWSELDVPQQPKGSVDCGLYAIFGIETVLSDGRQLTDSWIANTLTPLEMRLRALDLIFGKIAGRATGRLPSRFVKRDSQSHRNSVLQVLRSENCC